MCRQLRRGWCGRPFIQCWRGRGVFWNVQAAAQRMVEFWLGTFADPIYLGDWPASVKARIPYLPTITPELVRFASMTLVNEWYCSFRETRIW